MAGGLGRGAVLEVGYTLLQRMGILFGHFVTKEGELGCSKDAFGRVDKDPVPLKSVEEGPKMLLVLFE
jgi:hypothetical protein